MTVLILLFLIPCLISTLCNLIKNSIQQRQRRQAQLEREQARAEREQMRLERLEEKQYQAERKREYRQNKAQQQIDSINYQIEQNQELYSSIERQLDGNISERQRISYQRQLMAIDNRIYQLNNKLMDLDYIVNE